MLWEQTPLFVNICLVSVTEMQDIIEWQTVLDFVQLEAVHNSGHHSLVLALGFVTAIEATDASLMFKSMRWHGFTQQETGNKQSSDTCVDT
jgi:hypothetical protein